MLVDTDRASIPALGIDDPHPSLAPIWVATEASDEAVEQAIRLSRAHVAMLALQLRSLRSEGERAGAGPHIDFEGAREFVRTSLDARLATRRRELDDELESTRVEAAESIRSAQEEAAGILAEASREAVGVLLDGIAPSASPSLRVVAPEAQEPRADPNVLEAPVTPGPTALGVTSSAPRSGWSLRQFLYLDVVLPLVAVLIIVVILLAWVG